MAVLVPLVFSVPTALATLLLSETDNFLPVQLPLRSVIRTSVDPVNPGANPDSSLANTNPLVTGTLYTNGKASVDWNGVIIPVENGTYGYVGNEVISIAPDAMGVLQLDGGTIFLCPGSKARISRKPDGTYDYQIIAGLNRFMFDEQTPFEIRVNELRLTPQKGQAQEGGATGQPKQFVGEVKAHSKGGCLICELRNNLNAVDQDSGQSINLAAAGRIVNLSRPDPTPTKPLAASSSATPTTVLKDGFEVSDQSIPSDVFSAMNAGSGAGGGNAGMEYLCQCEDLKRYADAIGEPMLAEAEPEPKATPEPAASIAAPVQSASSALVSITPPEPAPPVSPPDAPIAALAPPGSPVPFDPNVLPPPAAGPTTVNLVVPQPQPTIGILGGGGAVFVVSQS